MNTHPLLLVLFLSTAAYAIPTSNSTIDLAGVAVTPPPVVAAAAKEGALRTIRSCRRRRGRSQHSFRPGRVDGSEAQMTVTAFRFCFIFLCFLLTINKPFTYFHIHSTKYYVDVIQCHLQFSDDVGPLRPMRPQPALFPPRPYRRWQSRSQRSL